jgi:hypothetical protein
MKLYYDFLLLIFISKSISKDIVILNTNKFSFVMHLKFVIINYKLLNLFVPIRVTIHIQVKLHMKEVGRE